METRDRVRGKTNALLTPETTHTNPESGPPQLRTDSETEETRLLELKG